MKKSILWAILVMLLPITQAWGGDSTYNATLTVNLTPSGAGMVYATKDSEAVELSAITDWKADSTTASNSKTDGNSSKSIGFYVYAKPNTGYLFSKWSDGSTDAMHSYSITASADGATDSITATFVEAPKHAVTFVRPVNGSYTVDSVAKAVDANVTESLYEAQELKLVATPDGGGFLGWYTADASDNRTYFSLEPKASYVVPKADVVIGAAFYTPSDVTSVTTAEALVAALNGKDYAVVSIDVPIDAGGAAVTVPMGKKLLLNNRLTNVNITYADNIVFGEGAYLGLAGAVAAVGKMSYLNISDAIEQWKQGTRLTLLADVTVSSTVEKTFKSYAQCPDMYLDLGTHRWTTSSGNAFKFHAEGAYPLAGNTGLRVTAKGQGGITVGSSSYCFYINNDKDDAGKADRGIRMLLEISGGVYNGKFVKSEDQGVNTMNAAFYDNGSDGLLVANGNIDANRANLLFHGGRYEGTIKNYVVGGTQYAHIYGGKFKSFPEASNGMNRGTVCLRFYNGVSILYDGTYYTAVSGSCAGHAYEMKIGYTIAAFQQLTGFTDATAASVADAPAYFYYADAATAMSKNASGVFIFGENVVRSDSRSVGTDNLSIDLTAAGADYTGNVTLNNQSSTFTIKLAKDKDYRGTVTVASGRQLHIERIETDTAVTYVYSSAAPTADTAEVVVDSTYYETIYDAFYALDGTKGKTIVLIRDIPNAALITNGRNASSDGVSEVTVDLNGHAFTLGSITAMYNANYTLTIVDTPGTGQVMNTLGSMNSLGYRAYMAGQIDDRASYNLVIKGGTWQFDPTTYSYGDQVGNFIPDGYEVVANANDTWTVKQITACLLTLPGVAHVSGVSVTVGGEPVEPGADGKYAVKKGDVVVVTYTAEDGYSVTPVTINGVAEDMTVASPTVSANVYAISYELDADVVNDGNPETFTVETDDITLNEPTRTGYDFGGWFSDAEKTDKVEGVAIAKGSTENKTFYAAWEPRAVVLTIPAVEHAAVESVVADELEVAANDDGTYTVKYGQSVVVSFTADDGYCVTDVTITSVTLDQVVETPTVAAAEYGIAYVLHEGENNVANPSAYTFGETVVLAKPTRTDYDFLGWYEDADFKMRVTKIAAGSMGAKTFYAKWEHVPVVLTIAAPEHAVVDSVMANGVLLKEVSVGVYNVPYRQTVVVTYKPEAGYGLTQEQYTFENVEEAVELGVQTALAVNYTITYVPYGGDRIVGEKYPDGYDIGTDGIELPGLTRGDDVFGGWYEDAAFSKKAGAVAIPKGSTGNKTFYASWIVAETAVKSVEAKDANGDDVTIKVKVPDNWAENVITNQSELTDDEVLAAVQEKLQETTGNGLKAWQNFALDAAGVTDRGTTITVDKDEAVPTSTAAVNVKVETTADVKQVAIVKVDSATVAGDAKEVDGTRKDVEAVEGDKKVAVVAVDYSALPAGVYRPAVVVEDENENEVLIPDVNATAVRVIKNEKKETKTVLTVPFANSVDGKAVTVASFVDTAKLAQDDSIQVYNKETKTFDSWSYHGDGTWIKGFTASSGGSQTTPAKTAAEFTLDPGQVIVLVRNEDSVTNAITLVGQQIESNQLAQVETKIEHPAEVVTVESNKVWSMVGNVDPVKDFDLNMIENANDGDMLVVPVENEVVPRKYTLTSDNGKKVWAYTVNTNEVKVVGGRTIKVSKKITVTNDAKLKGGEWLWYVSGGGSKDTKIKWDAATEEKR